MFCRASFTVVSGIQKVRKCVIIVVSFVGIYLIACLVQIGMCYALFVGRTQAELDKCKCN